MRTERPSKTWVGGACTARAHLQLSVCRGSDTHPTHSEGLWPHAQLMYATPLFSSYKRACSMKCVCLRALFIRKGTNTVSISMYCYLLDISVYTMAVCPLDADVCVWRTNRKIGMLMCNQLMSGREMPTISHSVALSKNTKCKWLHRLMYSIHVFFCFLFCSAVAMRQVGWSKTQLNYRQKKTITC